MTRRKRTTEQRAQTVFPSETSAARKARGMPTCGFTLPIAASEAIDRIAAAWTQRDGEAWSRSRVVAELVLNAAKRIK